MEGGREREGRQIMNPETLKFEPVTRCTPEDWKRLFLGQEIDVGGIPCRIRKITRKDIVLRPVHRPVEDQL